MKFLSLLVAIWVLGGCTSMLVGASGDSAGSAIGSNNRSASQTSMDDEISTKIRSRFALDGDLSGLGLRVATRQGIVTLRGTAGSFAERDRAIRLARDVKHVVRVDSQININTK